MHDFLIVGRDEERNEHSMEWQRPKREKIDFFEDPREDSEHQPPEFLERKKEKAPPSKSGPHWEVDDSRPSDFVKDFFKPA